LNTLHSSEIRRLRLDARRLEDIAKRLRRQAKDLAREGKLEKVAQVFFHPPQDLVDDLFSNER